MLVLQVRLDDSLDWTIHLIPSLDTEASVDYLANGAKALQVAIENDAEVSRRLADALVLFAGEEAKTKDIIREKLAAKAA